MPVTSSDYVYYGGFHVFSSAVFAPSGGTVSSSWGVYGLFGNWAYTGAATSSGAASVTAGRKLISVTGFLTQEIVVQL